MIGRQMPRSNSAMHHHRQNSDNVLDGRWFQSSYFSQEFGTYGGRVLPGLAGARSSSLRMKGDDPVLSTDFTHGLLDLNSFDTELLPELANKSWGLPENSLLST